MSTWHIQKGSQVKSYTEIALRAKLRSGDLSGTELVRLEGEDAWGPLHDRPIFTEEVAHTGDPRKVAWIRQARGFGWHAGIFLIVMSFLGFPWWGIFWGLGVLGHLAQTVPALRGLLAPVVPAAVTQAPPTARLSDDPFVASLEKLLAALEKAGEPVEAIRADALALHERRLAFDGLLGEIDIASLEAELAERRAADVPGLSESFGREAAALEERLSVARETAAARDRLAAQERELLHQLDTIRLSVLRARLEEGLPDAGDQLADIRRRLAAEAEVDERLNAARKAAARQRT